MLHLSTSLHGGAGRAAYRIHKSLLDTNIDSKIFALSGPQEALNDSSVKIIRRKRLTRLKSIANTIFHDWAVQKGQELVTPNSISVISQVYEEIEQFDIIHLHNIYNLTDLYEIADKFGDTKKVVITLHDQRFLTGGCHYSDKCMHYVTQSCQKCPQARGIFNNLVENSFKESQSAYSKFMDLSVVSPSNWLLEKASTSPLTAKARKFMIRNPVDKSFFSLDAMMRASSASTFAFVSLNLWNPYKGLATLLAALNQIDDPAWFLDKKFLFIGRGRLVGLPDFVKYEQISINDDMQLAKKLMEVDVVLVPSKQDNFPNVIPESLLSGCDLITSDAGGVAELSSLFEYGVFPAEDIEALSEKIENYEPSTLGAASRAAKAREYFAPSQIAAAYRSVYESR